MRRCSSVLMLRNDRQIAPYNVALIVIFSLTVASPAVCKANRLYGQDYDLEDRGWKDDHESQQPSFYSGLFGADFGSFNRLSDEMLPSGMESDSVAAEEPEEEEHLGMMDTFEKFKRQAEKVSVQGYETGRLKAYSPSQSGLINRFNWQTTTIVSVLCVGAAIVGVIIGVMYWPKSSFGESNDSEGGQNKAGEDEVTDRSLAKSAQMYHYQQQKQQMLAMEQAAGKIRTPESELETDEECDEQDENVYECPGLAPASEVEAKNPLFQDDLGNSAGTSSSSFKK